MTTCRSPDCGGDCLLQLGVSIQMYCVCRPEASFTLHAGQSSTSVACTVCFHRATIHLRVQQGKQGNDLCKGARIQIPFSCAICQSPDFSQHWPWQLTALKELDSIWPCQLVVVIWKAIIILMHGTDSLLQLWQAHGSSRFLYIGSMSDHAGANNMLTCICKLEPRRVQCVLVQVDGKASRVELVTIFAKRVATLFTVHRRTWRYTPSRTRKCFQSNFE